MLRVLTSVNVGGNEISNIKIENVNALPTGRPAGCVVLLTTDKTIYLYDGTNWIPQGSRLNIASDTELGGVKLGGNIVIDEEGVINTDCVLIYTSPAQFPTVGSPGNLYISLTDETLYMWNNTLHDYRVVSGGLVLEPATASVTTLSAGQPATVEVETTGTSATKSFNFKFGIPKGDTPNISFELDENGDLYVIS